MAAGADTPAVSYYAGCEKLSLTIKPQDAAVDPRTKEITRKTDVLSKPCLEAPATSMAYACVIPQPTSPPS